MTRGIYCITNTATGEQYVGCSVGIKQRIKDHMNQIKWGKHPSKRVRESFAPYGLDVYSYQVLEEVNANSHLWMNPHELKWIVKLAPTLNRTGAVNAQRIRNRHKR